MLREVTSVLYGMLIWRAFCIRFRITEKKVVLVLVNDREYLDYCALVYLEDYMNRKYTEEAVILFDDKSTFRQIRRMKLNAKIRLCRWPKKRIEELYTYYRFYKFSDRIVFTYTDHPKDNQLGRVLRETKINEVEAVCLGLYHLRRIPVLKKK